MRLPGRSYRGPLEPLTGREVDIRDNLVRHVRVLASEIGERNVFRGGGLVAAERYITGVFEGDGYSVNDKGFTCEGLELKNLEAVVHGSDDHGETVVVGAHYDTVIGSPGANDNGSGVAALLELTRLLRADTPRRTVRLVAFVNEEQPFFKTGMMGSLVYARRCRERRDRVSAMLSLETIGSYSDVPGSQSYPPMLSFFYPAVGDFVARSTTNPADTCASPLSLRNPVR
jgi:acetylornithine deacetylase/succinyl-diaminopimelate desuccinylase-like protein